MSKYFVVAFPPSKPSLLWDYPKGYFPRKVFYKQDAKRIAATAKSRGGEGVDVKDFTQSQFDDFIKQLKEK